MNEVVSFFEFITNLLLILMSFFDLLVDISETFGVLVVTSTILLCNLTTLSLIHLNSTKKYQRTTNNTSINNLYLVNTLVNFVPKAPLWLGKTN